MRTYQLFDRVLQKVVLCCEILLACFLGITLIKAFYAYPDAVFLNRTQSKPMLIFLAFSMAAFLFLLLQRIYQWLAKANEKILLGISIFAPVLMFVGQLIFLIYYRSLYMWDTAFVVGGASSLLQEGQVAEEAMYYLSVYPNQNMFTVLTEALLWFGSLFGMNGSELLLLCNVFNMLSMDVSIVFALLMVRQLHPDLSRVKWAFLWIVLLLQPFFYMGVSYYYTITLSLPWFMAFLYLCLTLFQPKRPKEEFVFDASLIQGDEKKRQFISIGKAALAGLCFAIGYLMRATTIIPFVAVMCCGFLLPTGKESIDAAQSRWRKVVLMVFMALVAWISVFFIKPVLAAEIGLETEDTAFPASHWVMMSMTSPGCHNAEDEAYTASFATKQEKQRAVWQRMQEKASNMDFYDWMTLASDKITNTWASGSNAYVLFMENCLHMDGIYPVVFGNYKDFMILYHQGMHILILLGIFSSCIWQIRRQREPQEHIFLLQLCLLGGFLFYLLWETGGQYSLVFFLLMLLLSLEGYEHLSEHKADFPYRLRLVNQKSSIIETQGSKRDLYNWLSMVIGGIGVIVVFVFMVGNVDAFTKETAVYTTPVVNQLLANGTLELKEETLTQSFQTEEAFNQIAFQWRNPIGEENDAVYQVVLADAAGKEYFREEIQAAHLGYQGAFLHGFAQVVPQGNTEFLLQITKTGGSEENTLEFVRYTCGNYDVYPYGRLLKDQTLQRGDLLLQVTNQREGSYTSAKRYFFFLGMCMIIFLFLEICCILQTGAPKELWNKLVRKKDDV